MPKTSFRVPVSRTGGTTEDYLKRIYALDQAGEKVTTSALASSLGLADASVTDMVKRLAERGLVRYRPYRGVELTGQGRILAVKIIRRHRLWEVFLVDVLHFPWDRVHQEAERLEHATSDDVEEALARLLGDPSFDPHGDPIPGTDGSVRARRVLPLAEATAGAVFFIARVSDRNPEVLKHASTIGLTPRARIVVRERLACDGSFRLLIRGKEHFISDTLARSIWVEQKEAAA